MPIFRITSNQIVKRLRWVMVGVIVFSIINTLAGQPESFWLHPETAIRGDGLSIYNPTNHTFDFFLGLGWQAYLIMCLIYLSITFLLVSILPTKAALVTIFSIVLGHFFGATNWLAVRWHLGTNSSSIYGIILSPIIVYSVFPAQSLIPDKIIKRLFWLMAIAMLSDTINTLVGQPATYWLHPETVHEGNEVSRYFLSHGWYAYIFRDVIYFLVIYWFVSILPQKGALICIFYFLLNGFTGASNWFFYEWRMGMQTPVIYGIVLSVCIVLIAFSKFNSSQSAWNSTGSNVNNSLTKKESVI